MPSPSDRPRTSWYRSAVLAAFVSFLRNQSRQIICLDDHCTVVFKAFCCFRVDGVLAIAVSDREGIPVLLGMYVLTVILATLNCGPGVMTSVDVHSLILCIVFSVRPVP